VIKINKRAQCGVIGEPFINTIPNILFEEKNPKMKSKRKGFTMVECIVTIVIIGILSIFVILKLIAYKEIAEEKICLVNRRTTAQLYEAYLVNNKHNEVCFNQFMLENVRSICPCNGTISYENGIVRCSIHGNCLGCEGEDSTTPEEVTWLKGKSYRANICSVNTT
jgi:prepilin-type N-terminal cleavage/methylation domain-containing protein